MRPSIYTRNVASQVGDLWSGLKINLCVCVCVICFSFWDTYQSRLTERCRRATFLSSRSGRRSL